jgi:signal transduction histidine kinase/DNA-binding NarL/FixJ family response regulator
MPETSTDSQLRAPPARILIVDADPDALETLSDAVTGLGYAVCHAAEPEAAVDLPGDAGPDLALIGLPGGEAAASAIKAAERIVERFGVPLVYATEAVETVDSAWLDRAQRTNPHGYVLRSAGPVQLDLTLRAALNLAEREQADRARHEAAVARLEAFVALAERDKAILTCLFDRISDAVILGDPQGRLTAVNPAARRMGTSTSFEDPNRWSEYFATLQGDGRTPFAMEEMPLGRALRGEATQDVPVVLRPRHSDAGSEDIWLSVSGYPLRDPQGQSLGGAVLLRDVTALREQSAKAERAEAELHERVQVLDAIIRSMADGVVVADAQAHFTLFNPSAERMVGIGMTDRPVDEWSDLYGVYYADGSTLVPPEKLPVVRALGGEEVDREQLFIRNPQNPHGTHISVNASPVRDEAGQVVGGVAVFRDVSERRRQEEALTRAFALGRLEVIDTVLHNIGNAINSVATGVDTLHGWFDDSELMKRFGKLADLVAAHDRDWISWLEHDPQGRQVRPFLLALLRDLLGEHEKLGGTVARVRDRVRHIVDIIRTQAAFANGSVEPKLVDLPATIDGAVKLVQESLGQRGVMIEVDCSGAPRDVVVQESRLQQMLVNLLKNAMEATDERRARLDDDPDWRPTIRVLARRGEQEDTLVIDVTDNGIGIEPTDFSTMFNAGYTTKKEGTGLGLHSAANFAIGSGGAIQPFSDGIGHGATLRVTLRLAGEAGNPSGRR